MCQALLNQAYRRLAWARDDALKALIADILKYPGVPARWREPELEGPQALILPMELNLNGKIARMFSTVTTVATPHDVTLQDLHVEVFYPADAETEATLQAIFGEVQSAR
jgi:MmyB-like transcription regulator ligand binding domain